jgi:putative acetyltransferase
MIGKRMFTIRRLEAPDVHSVLSIISACRQEYGLQHRVQSLLEPSDHALYETYRRRRSAYFVALVGDEVIGGVGIGHLAAGDNTTCELQRMYLRQQSRGRGIGHELLGQSLQAARAFQFRYCYAETVTEMTTAIGFYERHGFHRLNAPIGQTGHGHNDCWMLLDLEAATRSMRVGL